jgi:Protein of unknown function (DUF2924)
VTSVRRKRDCVADPGAASRAGIAVDHLTGRVSAEEGAARISDDLNRLDADLLRRRWRSVIGRPAPASLSRTLMIRILSWREQIAHTGDLDSETLAALAAALNSDHQSVGDPSAPTSSRRLRPGTMLVREHRGVLQRVMVREAGYAWNGKTFASLSAVALAITGTNWNGRRFFGLDRNRNAEKIGVEDQAAASGRTGSAA